MRVMGLDIATNTGLVVLTRDAISGPLVCPIGRLIFLGESRGAMRLLAFHDALQPYFEGGRRPDLVVFEGYSVSPNIPAHGFLTAELGGVARLLCGVYGVPYVAVPGPSLKKYVTGGWTKATGIPSKVQISGRIQSEWGYIAQDSDDADAYALARVGCAILDRRTSGTVARRETAERYAEEVVETHLGYEGPLKHSP